MKSNDNHYYYILSSSVVRSSENDYCFRLAVTGMGNIAVDPAGTADYTANAAAYIAELEALQRQS